MPLASLLDAVATAGQFPLLTGVTATFESGQVYVITGPNGAGKTSLLRVLAGLEPLVRGEGHVLGYDLTSPQRRLVRRHVGWLGHEGSFYDELTVTENLEFAVRATNGELSRLPGALEVVGLDSRRDVRAKNLSAGQRRRMGLAWLLVRRAELWLLDEPYASLDDDGRATFDDVLSAATSAGSCVVLTSHDPITASVPLSFLSLRGGAT